MRILVTGVAGFIGSNFAGKCLNSGYEIIGIDSLNDLLYSKKIKKYRLENLISHKNFTFVDNDINNTDLTRLLSGVDIVVNQAGLPGQALSWIEFENYVESNLLTVANLIEAAKQCGVKKFVQASTSSVYGELAVGTELQNLNPISPYGVTKLAAENLLLSHFHSFQFPAVILRYFSVYGPGQRPDMAIHKMLKAAHTGQEFKINAQGRQIRDFTYVEDIVDGTIASIFEGEIGQIYNLSSGFPVQLLEIVENVESATKRKLNLNFDFNQVGDQKMTFGDHAKAKAKLGYEPKTSLEEGIRAQYHYLVSNLL